MNEHSDTTVDDANGIIFYYTSELLDVHICKYYVYINSIHDYDKYVHVERFKLSDWQHKIVLTM